MHNSNIYSAMLVMYLAMNAPLAWAVEPALADITQHRSMTPQEYENYRIELQRKIEQVSPSPKSNKVEPNLVEPTQDRTTNPESGYGQGYRARAERSDRAARMSGPQGGAMHRGGGRNR